MKTGKNGLDGEERIKTCADLGRGSNGCKLGDVGGDRLLRISQAAAVLAISVRALYRLIADGKLPEPVKIGRAARMPMSDLQAYVSELKRHRNGVPL